MVTDLVEDDHFVCLYGPSGHVWTPWTPFPGSCCVCSLLTEQHDAPGRTHIGRPAQADVNRPSREVEAKWRYRPKGLGFVSQKDTKTSSSALNFATRWPNVGMVPPSCITNRVASEASLLSYTPSQRRKHITSLVKKGSQLLGFHFSDSYSTARPPTRLIQDHRGWNGILTVSHRGMLSHSSETVDGVEANKKKCFLFVLLLCIHFFRLTP